MTQHTYDPNFRISSIPAEMAPIALPDISLDVQVHLGQVAVLPQQPQAENNVPPIEAERSSRLSLASKIGAAAAGFNRSGTTNLLAWSASTLPHLVATSGHVISFLVRAVGNYYDARQTGFVGKKALIEGGWRTLIGL